MYYKVIACEVLKREIEYIASILSDTYDITYLKQDYHNTPEDLQKELQNTVDTCSGDYDALLLGYGLCSNGICCISSRRHKIVVPKAHDCISLFLGSKSVYKEYFDKYNGGVYWYNAGWIEQSLMPGEERYNSLYNSYAEQYGEDNAQYLMELEQGWFTEYTRCTFIEWPEFDDQKHKEYTKKCADFLNWKYDELTGSKRLLQKLLKGDWPESEFLVVPPGSEIAASFDDDILKYTS